MLRPYQVRWAAEIAHTFASLRQEHPEGTISVLGQMPTGAGKTRSAVPILQAKLAQGRRCAFVAELEESIDDTVAKINEEGIWCGVIKAGRASDPLCKLQVCSLKTLISRPDEIPPADFVIMDEAHGSPARTPRELFQTKWQPHELLGLSATPERTDKVALRSMFQALVIGPSVVWLQTHGDNGIGGEMEVPLGTGSYLVPSRVFAPNRFLEKAPGIEPLKAYSHYMKGKRAIALCGTVKAAEELAAAAAAAGIPSEAIHGQTVSKVRAGARERLTAAENGYLLTGVDVFTQAWDCPPVEGIIFARKFGSLTPWLQTWGRGMRPHGSKREIIGVDCWGSYWLHGPPEGFPLPGGGFRERLWNLDGKPVNPDDSIANSRCQTCGYIDAPGRTVCALCGSPVSTPQVAPTVISQTIYDVSSIPDAERDENFLRMMYHTAQKKTIPALKRANKWNYQTDERQWSMAFAWKRFLEKFKREPLNSGQGNQQTLPGVD